MVRILAIDTTQAACSVALQCGDEVFSANVQIPRQHTKQLLPLVDQVLAEAGISLKQLDAIAFGKGPGSFTGLRIACGVAQGLGFSVNIPLLPISSLATLAADVFHTVPAVQQCFVAFDARMSQIYAAYYQRGEEPILLGNEMVIEPSKVPIIDGLTDIAAAGCGLAFVKEMPTSLQRAIVTVESALWVNATAMLPLASAAYARGEGVAAELAEPAYVRSEITWKKIGEQYAQ